MPGELLDTAPASALAIYAHPDDPDVSCGGTLAAWTSAGCRVEVVICARGDKGSSDPSTDTAELVRRRTEEARASAAILGFAELRLLGHDDGELENNRQLRAELVAAMRGSRPEAVICPDPLAVLFGEHYYNHRDHRQVGWAALDAAAAAGAPLYFPEISPAFAVPVVYLSGTLEPTVWVDVSATVARKAEALACHESQLGETGEWLRMAVLERAEEAGREVGVRYAESFRRVRPAH